jgi:hypothetical protein
MRGRNSCDILEEKRRSRPFDRMAYFARLTLKIGVRLLFQTQF